MRGTKLCLGLSETYRLPYDEQVRTLRRIGFEGFFSGWKEGADIPALRKVADEEGMIYQSIHAPFGRIDRMWEPTDETPDVIDEQIHCLRACAESGVPIMVAHTFIGFTKHNPTQEGLDNFDKVVREAEKLGVKIALENTEGEEYLAALMAHFKGNPFVGFCWDVGHEMCYNRARRICSRFTATACSPRTSTITSASAIIMEKSRSSTICIFCRSTAWATGTASSIA